MRIYQRKRILIACEWSGRVRDAMIARGHDAWSCDLEPSYGINRERHIEGDVMDVLHDKWDMMIAFPPCTYLSNAGNAWYHSPGRSELRAQALGFVKTLMEVGIKQIAIENPAGAINTHIRKPDQIIQPWWFGDPYQKRTCLWLKNLPELRPTNPVHSVPWVGSGKQRPGVQEDQKLRSITFPGVAAAMATQWG